MLDQGQRAQVMDTVEEIHERREAVREIERGLVDLHQLSAPLLRVRTHSLPATPLSSPSSPLLGSPSTPQSSLGTDVCVATAVVCAIVASVVSIASLVVFAFALLDLSLFAETEMRMEEP